MTVVSFVVKDTVQRTVYRASACLGLDTQGTALNRVPESDYTGIMQT